MHIPVNCIKSDALIHLATALRGLKAWHDNMGGDSLDEPCLRLIHANAEGNVVAIIQSGEHFFEAKYTKGDWLFTGDALQ